MHSKIFDSKKGRHVWKDETICELHRQIYDLLVLGDFEKILPILEKAYLCGIGMTKKLVDYKCSLPDWEQHESKEEVKRIRKLRIELNNVEA